MRALFHLLAVPVALLRLPIKLIELICIAACWLLFQLAEFSAGADIEAGMIIERLRKWGHS